MTYLQKKKLAFMSIVNQIKGFVRSMSGALPLALPDCISGGLLNYTLDGNSVQNGTPTPDVPVEVESVGEYDEEIGKYKIPVQCSDGKGNSVVTNIYLDEPLRKLSTYADTIDFENQKVIMQIYCERLTSTNLREMVQGSTTRFYKAVSKAIHSKYRGGYSNCFKISATKYNDALSNNEAFLSPSAKMLYVRSDEYTLDEYKNLLDTQDVLIYYVLATPIEEQITLPKLPTFNGTTVYTIGTSIQPTNMSATYYATSKE